MSKFYNEQERKERKTWTPHNDRIHIKYCVDLSNQTNIYIDKDYDITQGRLYQIVQEFTFYWLNEHYPKLNGFAGFESVKWREIQV